MRPGVVFFGVLAATACSPDPPGINVSLPLAPIGAASYVVAAIGAQSQVVAGAIGAPVIVTGVEDPLSIRVHWYDRPLGDYGVPLGLVEPGACRACVLTQPLATEEAPLAIGAAVGSGDWAPRPAGLGELERGRLLPDHADRCLDLCPPLQARQVVLDTMTRFGFVAELPDGAALFGTVDGALYRIDARGDWQRLCKGPVFPASAGVVRNEENGAVLYVAGNEASLARLALDAQSPDVLCAYELLGSFPGASDISWLAATAAPTPLELWAVGTRGELLRYDGATLTNIARMPPREEPDRNDAGGLILLPEEGPRTFAASAGGYAYARIVDGIVTPRDPPVREEVYSMARDGNDPSRSLVLGLRNVGVIRELAPTQRLLTTARDIGAIGIGAGVMYTSLYGGALSRQRLDDPLGCPPEKVTDALTLRGLMLGPDSFLLADAVPPPQINRVQTFVMVVGPTDYGCAP